MVSGKYSGGVLTVSVTGKIDSANADAVENEINELRKNEHVALKILNTYQARDFGLFSV